VPHEISWEERGVWWRFYGNVPLEEIQKVDSDFDGDPRFDNQKYVIVDFSGTERIELPEEEVELFAAMDRAAAGSNPYLHIAIVAKTEEIKELASLYAANSPWVTKFFENMDDCRSWINEQMKKFR